MELEHFTALLRLASTVMPCHTLPCLTWIAPRPRTCKKEGHAPSAPQCTFRSRVRTSFRS